MQKRHQKVGDNAPDDKFDPDGVAFWLPPRTMEEQIRLLQGGLEAFRALGRDADDMLVNSLFDDCIATAEHLSAWLDERWEAGQ